MKLKNLLTILPIVMACANVAQADALDTIKERGTLVCGTLGTSEPFSFQDPKTRQVVGYEVDLCKEIADSMGVRLEVKMISVAARIPELAAGRVDVVAANLGWSADRAKQIDYSYADYVSPQKILIRQIDADKLKKTADLAGKRVSAVSGSSSEAGAKRLIPDITTVTFKDPSTAFVALQQKKVDGFVGSELMLLKFEQSAQKTPVKLTMIEDPLFTESWGLGVKKGEKALLGKINETMAGLEQSGKAQQIFDRWFGPETQFHTKRVFKMEEIKG